MFDDILGNDRKTPDKVNHRFNIIGESGGISDSPVCDNCVHGSNILSNFPDKVLCQKYFRHKPIDYKCRNWDLRK